jgi:sRNA-binding regulator protein Hfq
LDTKALEIYRDEATRVEVFLNNGLKFTGKITAISDTTITMLDKFNKIVTIESSAIIIVNPREKDPDEGWR